MHDGFGEEEHVVIDVLDVEEINKSEIMPELGEVPTEASASTNSAIAHVMESDITLLILTEEEEDRISLSKNADDFISGFNNKLKLQKRDSLLRSVKYLKFVLEGAALISSLGSIITN
ncbi:hypothetical protein O6P43_019097 [Quillaja saponaria]|uniref:Uncharacterized protein n=1 Tax=Quillaja saponaria TaxID=32244 RepID=A0AAD7LHQ1_QUISA|nr:hypothetical protein O6P43_019097 [Quillaja saponaria]